MFRIISPDGVHLALSETVQGVVEIVRNGRPGRYHIDETGANLLSLWPGLPELGGRDQVPQW